MYNSQTVKEYSNLRRFRKKRIGARIDYRISGDLNEFQTEDFIKELNLFCLTSGLELSGFGYKNYSGIILGKFSERIFKRKVAHFKKWLALKGQHLKMVRIGKVQLVNNIFFE